MFGQQSDNCFVGFAIHCPFANIHSQTGSAFFDERAFFAAGFNIHNVVHCGICEVQAADLQVVLLEFDNMGFAILRELYKLTVTKVEVGQNTFPVTSSGGSINHLTYVSVAHQ